MRIREVKRGPAAGLQTTLIEPDFAIEHKEWTWQGPQGDDIYAQLWKPNINLIATVCVLHGLGEHSGRYEHMARYFCKRGYAMLVFDLPGHGKSDGKRGHIRCYDDLLLEVEKSIQEASKRVLGKPKFVYGHSMGGGLAINFALKKKPTVAGIIAASPWLELAKSPPKGVEQALRIISYFLPFFPNKTKIDTRSLTRDPEMLNNYLTDPLNHDDISARTYIHCKDAGKWALDHCKILVPHLLLMHGSKDEITSYEASRRFRIESGSEMVDFKGFTGLYHELHNEPERELIFDHVIDWMNRRLRTLNLLHM